ncbi:MAG: Crp/Fnr family transcriptional regulator [Deltaproteobacteria bacterium]|nr:Crp/Fnr family transcriptional regulator [Deltaproteobacteria bacterium]
MSESDPLFERFGKECAAGEVLFREGEEGDCMYVIREGVVRITKRMGSEERPLAELGPGEFFGEMSILNGKPRSATAQVISPAKLIVIHARTFEQMVRTNAEIAIRLIKKLALRLDRANDLIEVLMHRDPKARVILGLVNHAHAIGENKEGGQVFLPLGLDQFCQGIGVSCDEGREVLARLRRLQIAHEGEDEDGRPGIWIQDLERLRQFFDFLEMRARFGEV